MKTEKTEAEKKARALKTDRLRRARERIRKAEEAAAEKARAKVERAYAQTPANQRADPKLPPEMYENEPETAWTIITEPDDPEARHFSKSGRPLGRPRKPISLQQVEAAASLQCTDEEIATICDVSTRTFSRRKMADAEFRLAIERGRANGKVSLRRKQFKVATEDGNASMLQFLGKNYLNQKDQVQATFAHTFERGGSLLEKLQGLVKNAGAAAIANTAPAVPEGQEDPDAKE